MPYMRVRVGISRWPDGWNVVVEMDGVLSVMDPTFATEEECEAKAKETAAALRVAYAGWVEDQR